MAKRSGRVRINENARLMQRVADSDFDAFEHLYQRFAPVLMYFFCRRGMNLTIVDDLTQKVFASLWERGSEFRGDSSFETYLISIARYTLNNELKQSRRIAEMNLKNPPKCSGQSSNGLSQPELELYLKELAAAVERAKGKLTERQRKVLEVANALDIDLSEASKELSCSHSAFKSRLKLARRRMLKLLAPFLNDENDSEKT